MDSTQAERLKRLQMADLGTARREHISTSDTKRFRERLEDIEALRMTNTAGSEAHRLAKKNEGKLSGWANVYKELGDTEDLEDLDPLLHGQSHRAQLNAIIHESGGQSYDLSSKRSGNHSNSTRATFGGRGGGVIGTRGRGSRQPSVVGGHTSATPSASSRTSSQGAVSKLGHHIVQLPPARSRPLDPALDINSSNISPKQGQSMPQKFKEKFKKPEQPFIKTRRPMSIPSSLCSPEDFLAAARSVSNRSSVENSPRASKTPDENASATNKKASEDNDKKEKVPQKKATDSLLGQPSISSVRLEEQSRAIPSPRPSVNSPSIAAKSDVPHVSVSAPAANARVADDQDGLSEVMSLETPSESGSVVVKTATEEPRLEDLSSKVLRLLPMDIPTTKQNEEPKGVPDAAEELLLDFSTTPPKEGKSEVAMLMSPIFEDLKGIDFQQGSSDAPNTPSSSSFPSPRRRLSFKESSMIKKEEDRKVDESTSATLPKNDGPVGALQHEIALLEKLMESTSLSDRYLQNLKECKQVLEKELEKERRMATQDSAKSSAPSTDNQPREATHQSHLTDTPGKATNNEPEPTKTTEEPKVDSKEAQSLSLPVEGTPSGQRIKKLALPEDSPSIRSLRNAVSAAPFVPTRATSFTKYRSPTNSISSDSTSFQSTIGPTHSKRGSTSSLLGDGLLPGRSAYSTQGSFNISKIGDGLLPGRQTYYEQNSESPESRLSVGDHLLPGRGGRSVSGVNKDTLSLSKHHADERHESKVKFSFPDRSTKVKPSVFNDTSSTNSPTQPGSPKEALQPLNVENISTYPAENKPKTAANAEKPGVLTTQPALSTAPAFKTLQKPDVGTGALGQSLFAPKANTMSKSIHAPKEIEENRFPVARSTSSVFKGGLQSSRYAVSDNHKPLC
ncbi:hypothetical protein ASPWEDRAFT_178925 [Aspergillus wentii DTO 134E9]|uniref:Uncharacterized protein n=1 Tax=Aspergillus wentii DTO 134E9 TaxID=1073089 RepID=A0A1L9S1Y1_ASPWE|nr:uncharacterized protein ASPWEDRAFT_178925 [Aspergillus wentii DTO 134E9]KAI9930853.1 hypothetical protein MW887_010504 [Aspergillus wentii]OJJ41161.1 hypothetical protein ASPWEDRAFT_178925 [Aspergillus wentii DTO 134E9]